MDYYLRVRDQGSRSQILQRCRATLTAKRLVLIWTPRGSYDIVLSFRAWAVLVSKMVPNYKGFVCGPGRKDK